MEGGRTDFLGGGGGGEKLGDILHVNLITNKGESSYA